MTAPSDEHYRVITFCGPTPIAEAYYSEITESLTDFLLWCRMYWKKDVETVTIEHLYRLATEGGRNMLYAGYPQLYLRWYRCGPESPKFHLN